MRIVNRETFLAMPAGTLFAKFEPNVFGPLHLKADTYGNDFVCVDLIPSFEGVRDSGGEDDVLARMVDGEPSPPLNYDSYGRDGFFDQDQLFAVFEERDVRALLDHVIEMTGVEPSPQGTPE